jgi:hypothetical protein
MNRAKGKAVRRLPRVVVPFMPFTVGQHTAMEMDGRRCVMKVLDAKAINSVACVVTMRMSLVTVKRAPRRKAGKS